MKTTKRFDRAVIKLYNAFHNGTLNAMDCEECAVGNICDNSDEWAINDKFDLNNKWNNRPIPKHIEISTGYSKKELETIETLFVYGVKNGYQYKHKHEGANERKDKEIQFKGLCAVVEYLCELDGIKNVLDYTKLFETENDKPKYQLT